jgi:hypothetical protein
MKMIIVFFMNDSKWNLDSKSLKEKEVSENNWKKSDMISVFQILSMLIN